MHQKLMCTMALQDPETPLTGSVQFDDAYLGGERPGVGGRGSPNKVPIVAAVSTNVEGRPMQVKVTAIAGFTTKAIANWARVHLAPGCHVGGVGRQCFAGLIDAGCAHSYIVVDDRKPRDLPQFKWVDTVLGNLKAMINGAYKSFRFRKYAAQYLGVRCYQFNRRFDLNELVGNLMGYAATALPVRGRVIRGVAEVHE